MYALALCILGDSGWAEVVVQDIVFRLWSDSRRYDVTRGDLRRWLLTLVHHAAVDGLRSKRAAVRTRSSGAEPLAFMSAPDADPSEHVWRTLRAEQIRAALARLPIGQREAIELVYFGGLTQAEVAQKTDQPLGTVKTRLRLGARNLRDALIETGIRE